MSCLILIRLSFLILFHFYGFLFQYFIFGRQCFFSNICIISFRFLKENKTYIRLKYYFLKMKIKLKTCWKSFFFLKIFTVFYLANHVLLTPIFYHSQTLLRFTSMLTFKWNVLSRLYWNVLSRLYWEVFFLRLLNYTQAYRILIVCLH